MGRVVKFICGIASCMGVWGGSRGDSKAHQTLPSVLLPSPMGGPLCSALLIMIAMLRMIVIEMMMTMMNETNKPKKIQGSNQ